MAGRNFQDSLHVGSLMVMEEIVCGGSIISSLSFCIGVVLSQNLMPRTSMTVWD